MPDAAPAPSHAAGWRLPPLEIGRPQALLDNGLVLLDGLVDDPSPLLRWYRSTHTAVVLGRGQRLPDTEHRTDEVEVIARHSGGGAVLMDPTLLSLDVIVPPDHPLAAGSLTEVFDRVGAAWADALGTLGVAELTVHAGASTARRRGTERERLLAAICYATLGRGEVVHHGRKLVGLAQRRRRHGVLVQCGVLQHWQPAHLLTALGADPHDAEIRAAAVGLAELGHDHLDDRAIIAAVTRALTDRRVT
jgi:lipoate---protein ligase